jgi:O-antigen/teichoic acid export membrane protein
MKKYSDANLFKQISDITVLKKKSAYGAISIFGSQAVSLLINIGSLSILARLLDPVHFGLIGMIMAIANFANIFQDLGLSMATIQHQKISHEQVSSLFWLNTAFGVLITVALCLAAPLISSFYGYPELRWLTIWISIAFIFSGMSIQHQALLKRRMQFGRLAILRCLSLLMAHFLAVLMAMWGTGVIALAALQVLTPLFMLLGCFIVLPWIPSFPRRSTQVMEMVSFGGHLAGFGIVTYFARNVDKIIIGHTLGSSVLGFYNKAYELMLLPLTRLRGPIIGVASPALSGLQNNFKEYRSFFIRFLSLLSLITFPLILCLVLCAPNIIRIVLGPDWMPATSIFRWLGIAAIVQPYSWALGILLVSLGKTRRYLYWGIAHSSLIVFSFFIGLRWGATGVAMAYAIVNFVLFLPSLIFCTNSTYVRPIDFIKPITYPFLIAIFGLLSTLILSHLIEPLSTFKDLLFKSSIFLSFYFSITFLVPKTRVTLIGTIRLFRKLLPC